MVVLDLLRILVLFNIINITIAVVLLLMVVVRGGSWIIIGDGKELNFFGIGGGKVGYKDRAEFKEHSQKTFV